MSRIEKRLRVNDKTLKKTRNNYVCFGHVVKLENQTRQKNYREGSITDEQFLIARVISSKT